MVLALIWLPGEQASCVIVSLLAVFSLARGICSVAAKDVLGKTVSRTRRGRLTGLATSAAGIATLGVAAWLWLVPAAERADQATFAIILSVAVLLWVLAAALYARIPEVPGATEGGGNALTSALSSIRLLRDDTQFRDFVIARILLVATAFSIPYIVVLIQRGGNGGIADLAALLAAEGAAGLLSGGFWGRWSDRASHLVMAVAAAIAVLVMGATLLVYLYATTALAHPAVGGFLLFTAAIAHHGARVGRKTYLVDIATQDNRAQYTAVSNTVMGAVLLSGGALGALDTLLGTAAVLGVLMLTGMAAIARCASLSSVQDR
jgi:predicted MFS family arabinose efflux permease